MSNELVPQTSHGSPSWSNCSVLTLLGAHAQKLQLIIKKKKSVHKGDKKMKPFYKDVCNMGLLSNCLLRRQFDWCRIKMFNFAGIKCRFKSSCPGSPLLFSTSGFNRLQYEIMWIMKALLSKLHIWRSCAKNVIHELYYSACRTPVLRVLGSHEISQQSHNRAEVWKFSWRVCCTDRLIDMLLHIQWISDGDLGVWLREEYWVFTDQPCLKAAVVSDGSCVHCSISMSATSNLAPICVVQK